MINLNSLYKETTKPSFAIGPYSIISQNPEVISEADRLQTAAYILPEFIRIWRDVESATGFRWKNTSYIRASPSHKKGHAFDLAPDIAPDSKGQYAVYNGSDPVLYKRAPLIRALQTLIHNEYGKFPMGIFIEPDHLHIQVLKPGGGHRFPTNIIKWGIAKPIYPDTYERMKLPLIE